MNRTNNKNHPNVHFFWQLKVMRVWSLRDFVSCVFVRFCNVLKEFPRLRSRYVLVLLFPPNKTNFSFLRQPLDPTLPFLAQKHSHCFKGSTFWASPSTFFMKWASPFTFFMKWREDHCLETQCAHQAQQKLRNLLSSTGHGWLIGTGLCMAFLTPIPIISLILILRVIGNHSASIGSSHPIPQVRLDQSRSSPLLSPNGSSGLCPMRGAKQKCSWNWTTIFFWAGGWGGGRCESFDFARFWRVWCDNNSIQQSKPCKNLEKTKKSDPIGAKVWLCGHVVCSFVFLFFWIFEVFAWSAPNGQNLENPKKKQKTKLPTTCPQSQTRAPMGSAVLFLWFSRFWPSGADHAATSKKKTKLQTPLGLLSDSVDMWSAVLVLVFLYFRGSGHLEQTMQKPRKSKTKTKNCRPHWCSCLTLWTCGLQFCLFCFFGFSRFWPSGADHAKTLKIKKTKLQTPLGLLSDSVDMWSAVLFFCFCLDFRGSGHPEQTTQKPWKSKNKTADPIGALVWLCGHVVCSFGCLLFSLSWVPARGSDFLYFCWSTKKIQKQKNIKIRPVSPV